MRSHVIVGFATMILAVPAAAQQPERETPPPPGPLRPFTVPAIRETRLPNGIRVAVAERRGMLAEPKRAEVLVAGAVVLHTIMHELAVDELMVSESDILDGLAASLRF